MAQTSLFAAVRLADRVVLQRGSSLPADASWAVEALDDFTDLALRSALATVVGNGVVTLSVDHQTVTVLPPSADWTARQTHRQILAGYIQQHEAALNTLYDQIATQAGSFSADLQAAGQIIQAWVGGVTPTQAQALVLIRVIIRILVFQASG